MAVVYWIHLPEHDDITTQGYVGVSSTTTERRFARHRRDAKNGSNYAVHRAMRKYGDKLIVDTVIEGSDSYCYLVENGLRPSPNTGWNLAVGGEQVSMRGRKHSIETKAAMSLVRKEAGLTKERIEKMAASRTYAHGDKQKDWNNPKSNRLVWISAEHLYDTYSAIVPCGQRKLAKAVGNFTSDNLETITAKFKNGWNPYSDNPYQIWKASTLKVANG